MPEQLAAELQDMFKGLKKQAAARVQEGLGKITTGKDVLDFSLYRWIAEKMLRSEKREYVFAHLLLVISWNLICRVGNTVSICLEHLEWREDALAIYFAQMKVCCGLFS